MSEEEIEKIIKRNILSNLKYFSNESSGNWESEEHRTKAMLNLAKTYIILNKENKE